MANIDLHGLQQGGNMFTNEIKNRTENVLKGSRDNINSAVDNAGEMLSNAGEAIREGYGQAKDYIENKVLGNQGSPNAEDFHDHGSANGGYQQFSSGAGRNNEGTAPTASAEEGAEVGIIEAIENMFPSGGGSGGMSGIPDGIQRVDDFSSGFEKMKKAKEKYKEQKKHQEQNKNEEGRDTAWHGDSPGGTTTIFEPYRPDEQ